MKATVTVSVRIPMQQVRMLRRAAEACDMKLATYIRTVAIRAAQQAHVNTQLVIQATGRA